jgi:ATP-dependent Lhr-like helicase
MNDAVTNSFQLLNPKVQKWVYSQGWTELRQIQEESVKAVIKGDNDIIISASTAGGKTEAAFLPIISEIINSPSDSHAVLCISPLKALINDQYNRLELISKYTDIKVFPWHGEISQSVKKKAVEKPDNSILMITPESIEAMFINKASKLYGLFKDLKFIVIDELHSFIGSERGKQLQSLLHRISSFADRRPRIVSLSATLGDMNIAKRFISNNPEKVELIQGIGGRSLKIKLSSFNTNIESVNSKVLQEIFDKFRGSKNLIFANSRADVEAFTSGLSEMCKNKYVPNEFLAHHGSLSKESRQEAEKRLKDESLPATIIATSTLELGIDVGSVKQVGQINAPYSVASIAQRLGRSGRKKNESSILRCYINFAEITEKSTVIDRLHPELIQTIAIINLLLKKWYEPPKISSLHLSTFIQQILSFIVQSGGKKLDEVYKALCVNGSFQNIDKSTYLALMVSLKENRLIFQDSEKILMLDEEGERLVNHYEFYSAFTTSEEYRVIYNDKTIGYIPTTAQIYIGMPLILSGRKWEISSVDSKENKILVKRSSQRVPFLFGGAGPELQDVIVDEMKKVLSSDDEYIYIDDKSVKLLAEARGCFQSNKLDDARVINDNGDIIIFTWKGSEANRTLNLMLVSNGLKSVVKDFCIVVSESSIDEVKEILKAISSNKSISAESLASMCPNKIVEKHDVYLTEELLCKNYASRFLSVDKAHDLIEELIQ